MHTLPRTLEHAEEGFPLPDHPQTTSELGNNTQLVLVLLLAHTQGLSQADKLVEFGLSNLPSMVGVRSAMREAKSTPDADRSVSG